MNENRDRQYLHLIQELLRCPNGQEETILAENRELLDAGFAEIIRQMESYLATQAKGGKVEFLLRLVGAIEQAGEKNNPSAEDENINLPESAKKIIAVLQQFVLAKTWAESQQVLETHPELLGEEADRLIRLLIAKAHEQENEEMASVGLKHYELITRCREVGIEKAFADKTGSLSGATSSELAALGGRNFSTNSHK